MAVVLAVLAAAAYGAGDFCAGLATRRFAAAPVSAVTQSVGLIAAAIVVVVAHPHGPGARELGWGAASGVGSGVGSMALLAGLASGQMSIAATLSAVLAAVVPALVGIGLGDRLGLGAAIGIVIAIPAIAMVSWQRGSGEGTTVRAGLGFGAVAGLAFALLFIALARAGTRAGAWPLIPSQVVALAVVAPLAWRQQRTAGRPPSRAAILAVAAGVLGGVATLLYLASTGRGQLAVVAVITSLYPAVTILLARRVLDERWSRLQAAGLVTAAVAIVLVTLG